MARWMSGVAIAVLVGCGGAEDEKGTEESADLPELPDDDGLSSTDDSGDGASDDDGGPADDTDIPEGLNGVVVDPPKPAPDFVATNLDGSARGRDDLTYRPTVMWFYPLAGTPG